MKTIEKFTRVSLMEAKKMTGKSNLQKLLSEQKREKSEILSQQQKSRRSPE